MKALAVIFVLLLTSCAPFIESNNEETSLGVTINHEQAANFLFNLFSNGKELSLVNEK